MNHEYELPVPDFFDPANAGRVSAIPYGRRAADARAWQERFAVRPAAADRLPMALILVDLQNTFCLPQSELFVAGRSGRGAVDDTIRTCRFIYRNLRLITRIHVTMDTHLAVQIFHPVFWVDGAGGHPPPTTVITVKDVKSGRWRPNPQIELRLPGGEKPVEYALHYVETLAAGGKYPLMIWPYHAMLGGVGHALVAAAEEAIFFHNLVRASQTEFHVKGNDPLTENYSVLRPEVLMSKSGHPLGRRNQELINTLLTYDMVLIAGQAKSHCVAWTVADLLDELRGSQPELARKVYLLEDLTSPVVIPGLMDFTEQAEAAFDRFAQAGVNVVRSAVPVIEWQGVAEAFARRGL